MRIFRLASLSAILLVLSACGGLTAAPQAAQPAIPLTEIDLASLLIESGDLPADLSAGEVRTSVPSGLRAVPPPIKVIDQRFQRAGEAVGGVVVLLYQSSADVKAAYRLTVGEGKNSQTHDGLGDTGRIWLPQGRAPRTTVAFTRCHAYVDVTIAQGSVDEVTAYARRLDQRLQPLVCP